MAFHDNANLQHFFQQLESRGVDHRWAWETRRDRTISKYNPSKGPAKAQHKWPDVGMVLFSGRGFQPSVLTAIIVDYGNDGFGLYTDTGSVSIDADVDAIAKPREVRGAA